MADRFPSLEDFDSGGKFAQHQEANLHAADAPPQAQTDTKDPSAEISADDFLAREKAILGADADQFATDNDFADGGPGNDLLGEGDAAQSSFESQFPDLASPSAGASGLPGASSITGPSVTYNSGYQTFMEDEEEPQVIKEWRERRDEQNAKRAQQFAAQREETIKEAQQNIDDFYENYNAKKEKGIAQTRKDAEQFLANQDDTVSGGTSWDRIAKLVDVSGKGVKGGAAGSGKERFREMLASLRKDDKAPGASGY